MFVLFSRLRFIALPAFLMALTAIMVASAAGAAEPKNDTLGVPGNYGDAMRWYERSAKRGKARAQFYLGMLYEQGQKSPDGKPDIKEAIAWFTKAAGQGHRQAQLKLGLIYYQGKSIAQDYKESAHWFEKAAAQGSSQAKYNLALMLVRGLGVAKDAARAAELFEEVVIRGIKEAALHLAVLYGQADRKGDPKDDNQKQDKLLALMWLEWAKGQGLNPDPDFYKRLSGSMTETEIAKARELALERLKK